MAGTQNKRSGFQGLQSVLTIGREFVESFLDGIYEFTANLIESKNNEDGTGYNFDRTLVKRDTTSIFPYESTSTQTQTSDKTDSIVAYQVQDFRTLQHKSLSALKETDTRLSPIQDVSIQTNTGSGLISLELDFPDLSLGIGNPVRYRCRQKAVSGIYDVATVDLLPTVLGDYASDALAEAGGVPVGGLYHTSGVVKIRLT